MTKINMQSVAVVAAAAFLAGTIVLLMTVALPANATPAIPLLKVSSPNMDHSAPTIAIAVVACSEHSWPHYAQNCLRRSAGDTRQVRVIDMKAR